MPLITVTLCYTDYQLNYNWHATVILTQLNMPPTKRRSYTAAFKLQVILHAEEHGNRAAGRQFGIGEAPVRDWRKAKDSPYH